jgi:hypothetical protein
LGCHIVEDHRALGPLEEDLRMYIGYGLKPAALPPDDTEELEQAIFPFEQVVEMVNSSEIRDAKTITAVLHAARLRK